MSISIVVPSAVSQPAEYSLFGYHTVLPEASLTGGTADPAYPVANALDYRDNTEFSPASTGTIQFIFTLPTIRQVNYFGMVSKNSADANLSVVVEVFDTDLDTYVQIANYTGAANGVPVVNYFGPDQASGIHNTSAIRVTLSSDKKAYILSMYCGKALIFPRTPSLGFTPAHLNPLDEVENFKTQGNNFTVGRRIPKGNQAKGVINFINFGTIDAEWPAFQQHVLNSRPVYFVWSKNRPSQAIYGLQNPRTLARPSYVTSHHGSLEFEINGYA